MVKKHKRISKSQYLKGLQCLKRLWLYRHRPDLYPDLSAGAEYIFDTGDEIHVLARTYFRGAVEVTDEYYEIDKAIETTHAYIKKGKNVICEATACSKDGAYSRIDILKKVRGSQKWDLIEVKSALEVKKVNYDDLALQRYAFCGAGYDIRKSCLMHLNGEYVRNGDLDIKKLFTITDCTSIIKEKTKEVKSNLSQMFKVLNSRKEPQIKPVGQCHDNPYACEYLEYCGTQKPDFSIYNVFNRSKARLKMLEQAKIIDVEDVPDDFECTELQAVIVDCHKKNKPYIDKTGVKAFLDTLVYPLYYFDFETIWPGVPLYDKSSPYNQIPFQFSLHIQKKKGGTLEHVEFLHTDASDPRPGLIKAMLKSCGKKGSVVVYNKSFEQPRIKEMGLVFPKHKAALNKISGRMVDLMDPFSKRHYYHPAMKGSFSIKYVLPALVPDLSYDNLEIANGGDASIYYFACVKGTVDDKQRDQIYHDLKKYCGLDTLAEARIIEVLYRCVK